MKKKPSKQANNTIQLLFLISVATAFIVQLVWVIYTMASQYHFNHNLSGYASFMGGSIVIPAVLFGLALFFGRQTKQRLQRIFEAVLLAASGVLIMGVVEQLYSVITIKLHIVQNSFWSWYRWELGLEIATVLIFGCLFWWLRRSKRWV